MWVSEWLTLSTSYQCIAGGATDRDLQDQNFDVNNLFMEAFNRPGQNMACNAETHYVSHM